MVFDYGNGLIFPLVPYVLETNSLSSVIYSIQISETKNIVVWN